MQSCSPSVQSHRRQLDAQREAFDMGPAFSDVSQSNTAERATRAAHAGKRRRKPLKNESGPKPQFFKRGFHSCTCTISSPQPPFGRSARSRTFPRPRLLHAGAVFACGSPCSDSIALWPFGACLCSRKMSALDKATFFDTDRVKLLIHNI